MSFVLSTIIATLTLFKKKEKEKETKQKRKIDKVVDFNRITRSKNTSFCAWKHSK